MSKSVHKAEVTAVDNTAAGFASIQARAAAASAKLRSMLGGAMAAAGGYLAFRSVKGGLDQLGHLSDIALKTSTSVDELTQATTALNVLGIQNMSVENLAKSFDYMAKTTGRAGMDGFYQTIEELGKIPDAAKRGQEAMRIFGRSGMEFMPLINAAKDGTVALRDVVAAMPGIPQAAADAGDAAADAMTIAGEGVKSVWYQVLGKIAGWIDSTFGMGLRGAAVAGVAWLEYFAKSGWRYVSWMFESWSNSQDSFIGKWGNMCQYMTRSMWETAKAVAKSFEAPVDGWINRVVAGWQYAINRMTKGEEYALRMFRAYQNEIEGKGVIDRIAEAWNTYDENMSEIFEDSYGEYEPPNLDDLADKLAEKIDFAKKLNVNIGDAAISLKDRKKKDEGKAEAEAAKKSPAIRNELMLGGSNRSLRAALLGPQLQSETKKQTKVLETIAKNTEKTAENTEGDGETVEVFN